jgi:hypothetical protein
VETIDDKSRKKYEAEFDDHETGVKVAPIDFHINNFTALSPPSGLVKLII